MDFENKLITHIQSICDDLEYILVDVSVHGYKNKQNIKVTVDTVKGIGLDQCRDFSREISDIIFRKNLIHGDYRLIVTSPGIEKPLEQDYEFKRNIGKKLAVNYITETQESMEIVGELIRYDGENIGLKVGKNEVNIAVNKIKKAKIKLKW